MPDDGMLGTAEDVGLDDSAIQPAAESTYGSEEAPPPEPEEGPLQKFMRESGLSEEDALARLDDRRQDEEAETQRERDQEIEDRAGQVYQQRFQRDFQAVLGNAMSDPTFRAGIAQMMGRYGLQVVSGAQAQQAQQQAQQDPMERYLRAQEARLAESDQRAERMAAQMQALEQRIAQGSERILQEHQYNNAVADQYHGFISKNPAAAEFHDELIEELKRAGTSRQFRDPRGREVQRFLGDQLRTWQARKAKFTGQKPGSPRPPRGTSGSPRGAARQTPDLSLDGITAVVLEDMAAGRQR